MFTNLKLTQSDFYLILWAVNHEKINRTHAANNAVTEGYRADMQREAARLAEIEADLRARMADMDRWELEADVETIETVEAA